jgi:hypothetical protein
LSSAVLATSTQEMLSLCKPIVNGEKKDDHISFLRSFSTGTCWGAFMSIQSSIRLTDEFNIPLLKVCAPEKSTLSQLVFIYTSYAEKHPERFHEDYLFVALDSLSDAFPCENKSRKGL